MEEKQTGHAPTLVAILACDLVIRDEMTHNVSLVGIFNTIQAVEFPTIHARMHVFVSLTDGRGVCDGKLCLVDRETEQICSETQGQIQFPPDGRAVVDMNFELRNIPFEEPGNYAFDFYVQGELIGSRPFVVVQAEAPEDMAEESEE